MSPGLGAPLRVGRLQTVFSKSRTPGRHHRDYSGLFLSLAHSDETTESHLMLSVLFCSLKKYLPFTHFELTGFSVAY